MNVHKMAIEKMISLAFEYGLICDYSLSPSIIHFDLGSSQLDLDPEEARFFLQGLLSGYQQATQLIQTNPEVLHQQAKGVSLAA